MALTAEGIEAPPAFSMDSTAVKAHPDAHGAQKKRRTGDRQDARRLEHQDPRGGGQRYRHSGLSAVPRERA